MNGITPQQLWIAALGELQVQVARPFFDTFLQKTSALGAEGECLVVGTESTFVSEYLEQRLSGTILETLAHLARRRLEVRFEVAPVRAGGPARAATSPASEPSAGSAPTPSRLENAASVSFTDRYSFDNFVVGPSNELANAAAVAAATLPGAQYNPVFIYSGVGLGKTHLLLAIGRRLVGQGLRVVYVTSDQFTTEFVRSVRGGQEQAQAFRRKYHDAGALLIDDVQLLGGKQQTLEALFHIFNELHQKNRQIVIASDRPPQALGAMEDRLRSRFEWGLIADIQPPDLETRMAILRVKADVCGAAVSDDVLGMISQRACWSVRDLEGHLNRAVALADLTGDRLTPELAARALGENGHGGDRPHPSGEAVCEAVARFYRVPTHLLKGRRRDQATARVRHVAMYLMREDGGHSLSDIGRLLGGRDHSTVHQGCEKIRRGLDTDRTLQQDMGALRHTIAQGLERQGP